MNDESSDRKEMSRRTMHRVGGHYLEMAQIIGAGREVNPKKYDYYLALANRHSDKIAAFKDSPDAELQYIYKILHPKLTPVQTNRPNFLQETIQKLLTRRRK